MIQERTGLFIRDESLGVIVTRLTSRLERTGCESLLEYYRMLCDGGSTATDEWLHVVANLSKPATSFLRHKDLVQLLVDVVIPQWVSKGSTEPLRIWSAGCATGEEPLTIAMALNEAGWLDRIPIELYGSDANFVAIEKAQQGVYAEIRMRYLSPELRLKYFIPVNDGWQVKPELHKRIRWSVANLMYRSEVAELAASQIIFCRNVFIYFSAPTICQTLRMFGELMPAGGYLCTDDGEYIVSLLSHIRVFNRQQFDGASIWLKRSSSAHT